MRMTALLILSSNSFTKLMFRKCTDASSEIGSTCVQLDHCRVVFVLESPTFDGFLPYVIRTSSSRTIA